MGVVTLEVTFDGPQEAAGYVALCLQAQLAENSDVVRVKTLTPKQEGPLALDTLGPLPSRTWPG